MAKRCRRRDAGSHGRRGRLCRYLRRARHSCAVDAAGKVFCWGSASEGELGVPGLLHSAVPTAVSIPEPIVQLRCNQSLTCARSGRGQVFCWGDDRAMSPLTQLTSRPPVAVAELAGSDDLWVLSERGLRPFRGALRCDGWVPASLPSGCTCCTLCRRHSAQRGLFGGPRRRSFPGCPVPGRAICAANRAPPRPPVAPGQGRRNAACP